MFKKILFFVVIIYLAISGYAKEDKMNIELQKINQAGYWKYITYDNHGINLYTLPYFRHNKMLFKPEDTQLMRIESCLLSPDLKNIIFTIVSYKDISCQDPISTDIYMLDNNGINRRKVNVDSLINVSLITFLGNDKVLLVGAKNNNERHFYIFNLNNEMIDIFEDLGESTVGKHYATTSRVGDLLVYDAGTDFIIYNMNTKINKKMVVEGDRPVLSPDGTQILFRRGGMTGDYYIVRLSDFNEKLILAEKKIYKLLGSSGGYRDLNFVSWSPDSKFILLHESSDLQKNRLFILDVDTQKIIEVKQENSEKP